VRDAEALARKSAEDEGRRPRLAAAPRAKDADTQALEGDLSQALGLTVEITDRGGAGEVRVKYATLEQLDELCRRLSRP
jgi:ParB family chromosome partitioning protein